MFEFIGTSIFDIGEGNGEYEYDFFTINSEEDFSAIIDYYRTLLERFNYFFDGYTTTKDDKELSPNVKVAMKDHNANVCLTFLEEEYIDDISKVKRIVINRKVSEGKYDTSSFHFYYLVTAASNEYNYYRKGQAFEKKGFLSAAINCYSICIKYNPHDAVLYGLRGILYVRTGDYDLAIDDCTKAIKLDKDNAPYILLYRGTAYSEKGSYTAAINDLSKAIKMEPNNAPAYIFRGTIYEKTGDFISARADYTKALELAPDETFAQKKLAALDDKEK